MPSGSSSNANEVAADLAALGVRAGVEAFAVTQTFGRVLLSRVQRRASLPRTAPRGPGTGGPRLQTGNYVRSWSARTTVEGGRVVASAGTTSPQGRRLELGFVGTDSAGRRVAQPPYPHAGPALDETGPEFLAALAAAIDPRRGSTR